MRVLVPVKRVIDPYVSIRVKSDNSAVESDNVKMSMNPFDEIALEEAIRMKEKGLCESITVISIGNEKSQETLRAGLALGADDAILVEAELSFEPLNLAKILKRVVQEHGYGLVIMGKQSIDGDNNQTPQYLAAMLEWPQATYVSQLSIENEIITAVREVDGGLETVRLKKPAVISTDLRLNEPRYATLPNIMKAKKKPLLVLKANELGLELKPRLEVLKVESPPARKAGKRVETVEALIDALRNEAKVI